MATTTLLFKPFVTRIESVELDASVSETHDAEVETSDHPIEEGADVTDHARLKPKVVTIEGLISNTPLNLTQQRRTVNVAGKQVQTSTLIEAPSGSPGYAEAGYARLHFLLEARQVITIYTGLRVYTNMVLTKLSIPRNATTGDAVRFTATFKQIRFVNVRRDVVKVPRSKTANPKQDLGKQVGEPTQPTPKHRSILRKVAGDPNALGDKLFGS